MCLMFSDRSMYMQITTKRFKEDYSKNTVYRFLNNSRINWERFTTMLSERIVNGFMRPLTSENRENIFVIDDSAYHKRGYKKTELVAFLHLPDDQINSLLYSFVSRLPVYLRDSLHIAHAA